MTTTTKLLTALAFTLAACGTPDQGATTLLQLQVTPPMSIDAAGFKQQLTAMALYADGHHRDLSREVTWSVLDPATASVDALGLVTATAAGTTRIVATLGDRSAVAEITVTAATLRSIDLVTDLLQVPLGAAVTAAALGHLSDGSSVDLTSQAFWSAPLGGLHVEAAGLARATATGPTRLCALYSSTLACAELEVTAATAASIQVSAAGNLAAMPRGALAALTVRATFIGGATLDVSADASWSSDAPAVALVEGGQVRGVALGQARLLASYQGQTASLLVTVTSAEVTGLALSPTLALAPLGGFVQLSVVGSYSDGTFADLTDQVTWSSLDPLAVQVSNATGEAGRAFGLVVGAQSVVTAELPGTGLSATTLVVVTTP
jgi:hypothetical protein